MNQYEQILHDMISLGISHIEIARKRLSEMGLKEEDPESKKLEAQRLMTAASVINDVLHPSYIIAKDLFEDDRIHTLLDYYKRLHDHYKHLSKEKVEDYQCPCVACSPEQNEQ